MQLFQRSVSYHEKVPLFFKRSSNISLSDIHGDSICGALNLTYEIPLNSQIPCLEQEKNFETQSMCLTPHY